MSGSRGPDPEPFVAVERMLREGPLLRVVNFHHTPPERARALERQLMHLARHFDPVDEARLDSYCDSGKWGGRPGIIPAFYNGYRSNFDVARPLLDRCGLVGWFFVASGFVAEPAASQPSFATRRGMSPGRPGAYPDGRCAMSWEEVRSLDGAHVIASHTRNHADVAAGDGESLRDEIVGAQEDFRVALGHPVTAFAANKGGPYGRNPAADRLIEEAGYRFVFSNLKVQRIAGAR